MPEMGSNICYIYLKSNTDVKDDDTKVNKTVGFLTTVLTEPDKSLKHNQ